jgi:isoquinoline 1-oxidoreductase
MKDVQVVQDGQFVGVAAPTRFAAERALDAIAATAKWERSEHPSSAKLFAYLREHARDIPANPFDEVKSKSVKALRQTYHVPYIQHTPMEPRAAVAQWQDGKLTVWTGSQNPFGVKGELARALNLAADKVQLIVPDFGGGFGGKHSGEAAVEAAKMAQAFGKPVSLRWTRREEFTWAYFRPAGVIDVEATLDDKGQISSWYFVNINSGPNAMETPYRVAKNRSQFVQSQPPLRHGSYRGLAATANTFARECAMDELAEQAGKDPLEFRLAHLDNPRLRAVLETAAKEFKWTKKRASKESNTGVGLACSTEKGSFVATCAQVQVDPKDGGISVRHVCQAFECGAIVDPGNLKAQNQGSIVMALGPALREAMEFENGEMKSVAFSQYRVPRFSDVPTMDIHLLNRPDLPSAGAGETPLITLAPAIANALFPATGKRFREMPLRIG